MTSFYIAFLNSHRSGVLTAPAWLVPRETAAISARSVHTIQHNLCFDVCHDDGGDGGIVQRFELESRCFINGMYYYYHGDAAVAAAAADDDDDDDDDKDVTWCTT